MRLTCVHVRVYLCQCVFVHCVGPWQLLKSHRNRVWEEMRQTRDSAMEQHKVVQRDLSVLSDLAANSWFDVRDLSKEVSSYHCPDLWLSDPEISFYPAVMQQLKRAEPAAWERQREYDVYGFCAKLTSMPGEMWLPFGRAAPLMCSVWKQQVCGTALHLTVQDAQTDELFHAEVLQLMQCYGVFQRRFYDTKKPELSMDQMRDRQPHTRGSGDLWTRSALLALYSGVSCSCTLQLQQLCAAWATWSDTCLCALCVCAVQMVTMRLTRLLAVTSPTADVTRAGDVLIQRGDTVSCCASYSRADCMFFTSPIFDRTALDQLGAITHRLRWVSQIQQDLRDSVTDRGEIGRSRMIQTWQQLDIPLVTLLQSIRALPGPLLCAWADCWRDAPEGGGGESKHFSDAERKVIGQRFDTITQLLHECYFYYRVALLLHWQEDLSGPDHTTSFTPDVYMCRHQREAMLKDLRLMKLVCNKEADIQYDKDQVAAAQAAAKKKEAAAAAPAAAAASAAAAVPVVLLDSPEF